MFELTIYKYDDEQVLGRFETREAAVLALGEWFLEHGEAILVHPRVREV